MNIPTVQHWSGHHCTAQHRTAYAFIKCSRKKERNHLGRMTNSGHHNFNGGTGNWVVVHNCYVYYGKTSFTDFQYYFFNTEEEARTFWHKHHGYCNGTQKCSGTCNGLKPFIVEVTL